MCSSALADDLVVPFDGARAESVKAARDHVRDRLGRNHPAYEVARLLVSELVTNAIRYTHSAEGTIWVRVDLEADHVRIDVIDEGSIIRPKVNRNPTGENGRGLVLVEVLSVEWGFYDTEVGSAVYCRIANDPVDYPA